MRRFVSIFGAVIFLLVLGRAAQACSGHLDCGLGSNCIDWQCEPFSGRYTCWSQSCDGGIGESCTINGRCVNRCDNMFCKNSGCSRMGQCELWHQGCINDSDCSDGGQCFLGNCMYAIGCACAAGEYSVSRSCVPCTNAPANAHYVEPDPNNCPTNNDCPWACNAGFHNAAGGCHADVPTCPSGKRPLCVGNRVGGELYEFHPHPTDCNYFFICSDVGVPVCIQCPANLHWNPTLETCDYPQDAGCTACPQGYFRTHNNTCARPCTKGFSQIRPDGMRIILFDEKPTAPAIAVQTAGGICYAPLFSASVPLSGQALNLNISGARYRVNDVRNADWPGYSGI